MSKQNLFFAIALVVVFAILQSGEALKCYQCASSNKSCESPGKNEERDCSVSVNTCEVCSVDFKNDTVHYIRSCGSSGIHPYDVKLELNCIACTDDLCNNADGISINKIVLESLAMLWIARFVLTNSY